MLAWSTLGLAAMTTKTDEGSITVAGPGRRTPPVFWPAATRRSPAYADQVSQGETGTGLPTAGEVRTWLRAAPASPADLPDEAYAVLLGAGGQELEELCALADQLRQQAVGDTLTYVVNRNLDPAAVAGAAPGARERLAALVTEAVALGATEICMQGPLPPGADDD